MKKPKISFRVFGDSGPLSAYFFPGPYRDAVEAQTGDGVGWFSSDCNELLCVEFDDVAAKDDSQMLKFQGGWQVVVEVKKGRVEVRRDHHSQRKV